MRKLCVAGFVGLVICTLYVGALAALILYPQLWGYLP